MTIVEPLPDLQWGKGAWQDYISNWRTRDTGWMQERLILRYQTPALRTADWGATPKAGQVTYNATIDALEMWSATKSTWAHLLLFQYLAASRDDATGVYMYHSGSSNTKGVMFTPTNFVIDQPTSFLTGLAVVDATGLSLKVGAKTAKLSTDAANLVSDSPISAPSIVTSGAVTVGGALTAPSFSVPNLTVSTSLNLAGATLTGGVLNPVSATIGGVGIASNIVTLPAGTASANAAGIQAGQGYFYGDGNSGVIRQRASAGVAAGAAYAQVTATTVNLSGSTVSLLGQPQIASNLSMQYLTNAGTFNGGPVIVQTSDPGVGNVPEGTIWVQA